MACTLEELQNVEYEILCKFDDFCAEYGLNYILDAGTMLGAVRHNGFIPWDDDVDVLMNIKDFKRFIKKIKKHPIDGMHLTWLDSEPQNHFQFAKLRKNGTYMLEDYLKKLDVNNGVWIDIFTYFNKPKNPKLELLQENLFKLFIVLGRKYINQNITHEANADFEYSAKYRFFEKLPDNLILIIRKMLFSIISNMGSNNSEYVMVNWWMTPSTKKVKREFYYPTTKHIFNDREFCIPVNYDKCLTMKYGDYMIPVESHVHTNLEKVEL